MSKLEEERFSSVAELLTKIQSDTAPWKCVGHLRPWYRGLIDLSHAPLADEGGDVVMGEAGADFEGHQLVYLVVGLNDPAILRLDRTVAPTAHEARPLTHTSRYCANVWSNSSEKVPKVAARFSKRQPSGVFTSWSS